MGLKTPVAFLVFNRPDTTEQVFAAIRQTQPEMLLVVADGPRSGLPDEGQRCAQVRAIVDHVDWPCRVLKNYSDINLGCKQRVSSGLDWVFAQVEEAIILEDDCLPNSSFFPFCEKLLEYYRDDERVMMVAGSNFLLETPELKESYCFSRYFPIWGWATWRRAWQHYDLSMQQWPRLRQERQIKALYSQPYMWRYVSAMMDNCYQNRINTWDIQWVYSCLFNNGLSAVPRVNLISNIGLAGTHTSGDLTYNLLPVNELDLNNFSHAPQVHPNYCFDNALFRKMMKPTITGSLRKIYYALRKRFLRTSGQA